MKNKFITTVVATALALTMTFSLANGMDVKAAEITEDSLVAAEDTNVGNESVDIQQQEPVEISELETTENNDLSKSSESITVDESIAEDILATQADTAVVVGTVSDYLTAKGDAKLYNINLPAGVYLQAQLTTPANADLDYDLYLLDAEGNILTGSDYYTYGNGNCNHGHRIFMYEKCADWQNLSDRGLDLPCIVFFLESKNRKRNTGRCRIT